MRVQRTCNLRVAWCHAVLAKSFESHDDAGRAVTTLAATAPTKRFAPCVTNIVIKTINSRNVSISHAPHWRDTTHPRLAVNPHRAATTLALGAATRFGGSHIEILAQRRQQSSFGCHLYLSTVHPQFDGGERFGCRLRGLRLSRHGNEDTVSL
jgi:hypothetical protein